ncbi:transporter substrate-binding domain-containing protein [Virgibacillus halophilus]|uniref:Transporter substrate-binding domain-containing protein n=1 Tax=Tigheibacillus halophilus TaxID=361280 RepID=A0ABU5C3H9_9BACI|nr:transporter substrate-binding domain-containing protein [Virgibacillus halophilus]
MKKIILFAVMLICLLALAACGSSDKATGGNNVKEVYKVGVDTTYPPFEFQEDGKYKGIDIDLIQAIAKDQGFKVKIEAMDFGGIIPSMQAGELDIGMGGMSITDERKETVDFSDPYFEAGLSLVVAKGNGKIASLKDLKGKMVAIKNGTTGAKFAEDHKDEYGYDTIQVSDSTSMFQEVSNGSADALIEDYPVISYAIATSNLDLQVVGDRLNGDNYGMSVMKGKQDELLKKLNDGLASLKESGKYDEILDKYLGE